MARLLAMNAAEDGRYIPPPPPPGPPSQPQTLRSPGSAGQEHNSPLRRGPVLPLSHLNTALPGFTPVHAQAPASPYTYRSPAVVVNSITPQTPHGQVIRNSPLSSSADSPSMAYRSTSGSTMMEYNPSQWARGGPIGGAYRPHTTLTVSAAPRQLDDSGRKSECILCQECLALVRVDHFRFSRQSLVLQTYTDSQKLKDLVHVRLTTRLHRTTRIPTSTIHTKQCPELSSAIKCAVAATPSDKCSATLSSRE